MNPTQFAQQNIVMNPPPGMEECVPVHACKSVCNGEPVVITAWKPTPEEITKMAMGQPVYLVLWGTTMQPALVTADNPWE